MPTPGERRALIFFAVIAALGVAVRGFRELRSDPSVAGDRAGLARQIEAVDSAIAVGGTKRGRGAHDGRATVAKPKEQPGARGSGAVQPALPEWPPQARFPKEWVAPGPTDLVRGDARRQHQALSDSSRLGGARRAMATPRRTMASGKAAAAGGHQLSSSASGAPVDLDTAPLDEIASIPVIGPALARRIVTDRIEHGPFGSIDGLERVRGISRALARRFQSYVTFSLPPRSGGAMEQSVVAQKGRRP
jgi:competence protein ComEA